MAENIFTEEELEALRVSGIQVQIAETERLRAEINELEKQI